MDFWNNELSEKFASKKLEILAKFQPFIKCPKLAKSHDTTPHSFNSKIARKKVYLIKYFYLNNKYNKEQTKL